MHQKEVVHVVHVRVRAALLEAHVLAGLPAEIDALQSIRDHHHGRRLHRCVEVLRHGAPDTVPALVVPGRDGIALGQFGRVHPERRLLRDESRRRCGGRALRAGQRQFAVRHGDVVGGAILDGLHRDFQRPRASLHELALRRNRQRAGKRLRSCRDMRPAGLAEADASRCRATRH